MNMKEYVKLLKRTGKKLDEIRLQELRASGSPWKAAQALDGNFQLALRTTPPTTTSGLVQFQRAIRGQSR